MEDVLSKEEIDALLDLTSAMGEVEMPSKEEIDALMDELTGGEKVKNTGVAYNPEEQTGGVVRSFTEQIKAMYNCGYRDGKKDGKADAEREAEKRPPKYPIQMDDGTFRRMTDAIEEDGYQRGLNEAWAVACQIYDSDEIRESVFGATFGEIVSSVDIGDVLAKIRKWEEEEAEDDEIKVGDEVIRHWETPYDEGDSKPSIFLREVDGDYWECLTMENGFAQITCYPKNQYRKTGKTFPQIGEALKQMEADNE